MSAEHYFSADPKGVERRRYVNVSAAGREFRLVASSGVFSADRLDPGTAVLLRKAPLPTGSGRYLDLGCGYGPIATALAAASGGEVYAVDVNARALDLVRENAHAHSLGDKIVAATPEEVPAELTFDEIWSNPPIRVGKAVVHELMETWLPRLAEGGTAWLVVAKFLGADSLQDWLGERGWEVERHASQKGYRVFKVTRAEED
ncbi:class I SAM-dependent methyltransferase [Phytomonospora endophytica]|uniref:16S rRNA G1207 methylase RsmC n=1 Tax=Phytomonospora endophytica TaxID=714109 RepID=A0A841FMU8_9ACTN|nr:methyltransferase [Phytomonospora endophytica]MBB6037345.1 16S rRNA G1207 methylase RsmC [Phytomonospora endophytica]GIG69912.1 16S RNA G1207 methylase RsmC [Phytomonospora endophytica]